MLLDHPLIDPLIATADQYDMAPLCQPFGIALLEWFAYGSEKYDMCIWRVCFDRSKCIIQWLGCHQHPCATTDHWFIDFEMFVGRVVSGILIVDRDLIFSDRTPEDRICKIALNNLWEECYKGKSHRASSPLGYLWRPV